MNERGNKLLKFFDVYAGIPLILVLGLFHLLGRLFRSPEGIKKSMSPDSGLHILCLKTAAIGDTVILSGVLRDIRKNYPN